VRCRWVLLILVLIEAQAMSATAQQSQSNGPLQIATASAAARDFYEHGAVARGRTVAARPPAFSCAVASNGNVLWAEAFGFADLEQRVPATPLTVFRIGSLSKPLTAAGALLLYDRKQLDLDVPIQTYVASFPDKGSPITIRELLGHLGGIRHYGDNDFGGLDENIKHYTSLEDGLVLFENDPLVAPPRTKWSYSSYGFNLVGVAIEHISGQDFASFMRVDVFKPLVMKHTDVDDRVRVIVNRAAFYEVADDGSFINAPFADLSYKYPSGGLLSTPTDLVLFASALLRPGFLTEPTRRLLFTSQETLDGRDTGYGMGWQLKADENGGYETGLQVEKTKGERYFWHRGAGVGGHAALVIYPDANIVAACAENTSLASVPISLTLIRKIAAPFMP
ncbi:MAG TPA: serine hydrolase domain-containing protein, partial [Candidatus Acidoferrales bacterium]|nr:serine hydrolase domain-containing protein [Candidatus Acidoferrales bacterium]